MKITDKKIEKAINQYKMVDRYKLRIERKNNFSELVDEYGIELVAKCAGLKLRTLYQYLNSNTSVIGHDCLEQAQVVLQNVTASGKNNAKL